MVANSCQARIFQAESARVPLREPNTLTHPESRLPERELTADLSGHSFDSASQGRYAMEQKTSAKQQEAIGLGREAKDHRIAAEIPEDWTQLDPAALHEHISDEAWRDLRAS